MTLLFQQVLKHDRIAVMQPREMKSIDTSLNDGGKGGRVRLSPRLRPVMTESSRRHAADPAETQGGREVDKEEDVESVKGRKKSRKGDRERGRGGERESKCGGRHNAAARQTRVALDTVLDRDRRLRPPPLVVSVLCSPYLFSRILDPPPSV